jgi:hypothetical protein
MSSKEFTLSPVQTGLVSLISVPLFITMVLLVCGVLILFYPIIPLLAWNTRKNELKNKSNETEKA